MVFLNFLVFHEMIQQFFQMIKMLVKHLQKKYIMDKIFISRFLQFSIFLGAGVVCTKEQYIDLSPLTPEMPKKVEEQKTTTPFVPVTDEEETTPEVTEAPEGIKKHCKDGWIYWNFYCYKFEDYVTDFFEAVRKCNNMGATLAIVESDEEMVK